MPRNHSPSGQGRPKKNRNSMHAPGPAGPPPAMMPGEPIGGYYNGPPPPHMGGPFYPPPPPHHSGPPPSQQYHQTPPAAPPAPNSGQPTPYSSHPHSPASSNENLAHYSHIPPASGPQYYPPYTQGPPAAGPPPPGAMPHYAAPPPGPHGGPPLPPHMRAGANGDMGRRAASASRQYDREPELYPDYRQQRPIIHSQSSSSGNARPDSDDSGPYVVMPAGGNNRHSMPVYRAGSTYSESSYEYEPRSHAGKAYMVPSSGAGTVHRRSDSREYQQIARSHSDRRSQGAVYQTERSGRQARRPARRDRSMSRPPPPPAPAPMSDDEYFERDDSRPPPPRRLASAPQPGGPPSIHAPAPPPPQGGAPPPQSMSGALAVRPRSPSPPSQPAGQLIRRKKSSDSVKETKKEKEKKKDPKQNIRIEVGGQAINLSFSGGASKSVGNITINTTRTVTVPDDEPASPPPAPKALPAPEPEPKQLALPSNVPSAVAPAPPPPSALPPPGHPYQAGGPPPAPGPPHSHRQLHHHHHNHHHMGPASSSSEPDSPPQYPYDRDLNHSMSHLNLDPQRPAPMHHHSSPAAPGAPPPGDQELRWTKISRDIVSARAVRIMGYDYEEAENAIIIYRVLEPPEIDELVVLSEQIRTGNAPDFQGKNPRGSHRGDRRRRRRSSSVHDYSSQHETSTMSGPGPSRSRPPPAKPAIVHNSRLPEAPPPPREREERGPPPVVVEQTKGSMRGRGGGAMDERERIMREVREERERVESERERAEREVRREMERDRMERERGRDSPEMAGYGGGYGRREPVRRR